MEGSQVANRLDLISTGRKVKRMQDSVGWWLGEILRSILSAFIDFFIKPIIPASWKKLRIVRFYSETPVEPWKRLRVMTVRTTLLIVVIIAIYLPLFLYHH
jgi:hypothetical protein